MIFCNQPYAFFRETEKRSALRKGALVIGHESPTSVEASEAVKQTRRNRKPLHKTHQIEPDVEAVSALSTYAAPASNLSLIESELNHRRRPSYQKTSEVEQSAIDILREEEETMPGEEQNYCGSFSSQQEAKRGTTTNPFT